jgi:hypothetical protein
LTGFVSAIRGDFDSSVAGRFAGRGETGSVPSSAVCLRLGLLWRLGLGERRGLKRRGLDLRVVDADRGNDSTNLSPSDVGPLITTTSLIEVSWKSVRFNGAIL